MLLKGRCIRNESVYFVRYGFGRLTMDVAIDFPPSSQVEDRDRRLRELEAKLEAMQTEQSDLSGRVDRDVGELGDSLSHVREQVSSTEATIHQHTDAIAELRDAMSQRPTTDTVTKMVDALGGSGGGSSTGESGGASGVASALLRLDGLEEALRQLREQMRRLAPSTDIDALQQRVSALQRRLDDEMSRLRDASPSSSVDASQFDSRMRHVLDDVEQLRGDSDHHSKQIDGLTQKVADLERPLSPLPDPTENEDGKVC